MLAQAALFAHACRWSARHHGNSQGAGPSLANTLRETVTINWQIEVVVWSESIWPRAALKILRLMFHLLILIVLILDLKWECSSRILFFFFASYAILFTQSDSGDGLKLWVEVHLCSRCVDNDVSISGGKKETKNKKTDGMSLTSKENCCQWMLQSFW